MMGLILKDLYVLKKSARIFILLIVMYVLLAFFVHTDFGILVAFITGMLSITSFAYDEQAKWDAYALTMPLSKHDLVTAKYLLALLLGVIGALIGALLNVASGLGIGSVNILSILTNIGLALCVTYVFSSIAIPLLYKLGADKSRLVLMLCYMVPIIGSSMFLSWMEEASVSMPDVMSIIHTAAVILPFFTVLTMALSYRISLSVLKKKDV